MPAEKIIAQIQKDSKQTIQQIQKEAEQQASTILSTAKKEAHEQADKLLATGKQQSETIKKIMISKAHQDVKRHIMHTKETLIEECFTQAQQKLTTLNDQDYENIVTKLMNKGKNELGTCTAHIATERDRKIAEKLDIPVSGTIKVSGGVLLISEDGNTTLDYTFEGILKRRKDEIRIKAGKLLFGETR
jgi:V/A-type H+-transporting ATPase subunit E